MRASFELITYYMARRLLGLVARVIARMPPQRPQDAQDGPSTPETTNGHTRHNSEPPQGRDGDTMNDEYTPEDFKNVRFAKHPDGRVAVRIVDNANEPWTLGEALWASGADMARAGWQPVREHAPVTLDTLREAWENAEQSGECREGDALIRRDDYGGYKVYRAAQDGEIWNARVLHRAQQSEPWQALADVMIEADLSAALSIPELAEALHQSGVRVTGGDER